MNMEEVPNERLYDLGKGSKQKHMQSMGYAIA